eukprot:Nk52_evm28s215 gene=Nk52_evmTU28s215
MIDTNSKVPSSYLYAKDSREVGTCADTSSTETPTFLDTWLLKTGGKEIQPSGNSAIEFDLPNVSKHIENEGSKSLVDCYPDSCNVDPVVAKELEEIEAKYALYPSTSEQKNERRRKRAEQLRQMKELELKAGREQRILARARRKSNPYTKITESNNSISTAGKKVVWKRPLVEKYTFTA